MKKTLTALGCLLALLASCSMNPSSSSSAIDSSIDSSTGASSSIDNSSSTLPSSSDSTLDKNEVVVGVEESDRYIVLSANPVVVHRGEDVSFKVRFNGNYEFVFAGDATYEDGVISLANVQYSQTIRIECNERFSVAIDCPEDCHFEVVSDNPVRVWKGESASFELEFEDGYAFQSSAYGQYENGRLVIEDIQMDLSVGVFAKQEGFILVSVADDAKHGYVTINGVQQTEYYALPGEEVLLEAHPYEGKRFTCWTIGETAFYMMPHSFEREFAFTVTEDISFVPNYWDHDPDTIVYWGNGATTKSGDEAVYYHHIRGNHVRLNTIQGTKAFSRPGYMLDSWNTKADGTGERIGLGSRVKVGNEPLDLYAIWKKENEPGDFGFELVEAEDAYKVTGCTAIGEDVVIPAYYQGLPVTELSANSFVELEMRNLYLPETMEKVSDGAVVECSNLDSLHFYDSLDSITDDFYVGNRPAHLFINANTDPCFCESYQNLFVRKTDLLLECADEKVVLIGNSNTLYSVDGALLAEELGTDVLCYGVQSAVGQAWELACLRYYCKDAKNTIVFCSEFNANSLGSFSEHKYYAAESNYDLLSIIDFDELPFPGVFGAYSSFRGIKKQTAAKSYSRNDYYCDKYGCLKMNIEPAHDEDWYMNPIRVDMDFYQNGGFNWVQDFCDGFTNSTILQSCCSFNRNAIEESSREAFYGEFQQSRIGNTKYPVISSFEDYAFPGSAFYEDNYHLIYSYAVERTNRLIQDLSGRM